MAVTTDPRAQLEAELAALEKKLGKGTVHRASEMPAVYHLPFRNPHMNYATEGGAPWNRFISLYGDESTGKTLCALELTLMGQQLPWSAERLLWPRIQHHRAHGHDLVVARLEDELEWIKDTFPEGAETFWIDAEAQFDKTRAAKLGLDVDRVMLAETNIIEDIGMAFAFGFRHYPITVVDSTSNAISNLRSAHDPGKSLVGTEARQWKYILLDAETHFGPTKNGTGIPNLCVLIHQMSTNMKTGGSSPASSKFMRFTSSCSVRFSRGPYLWRKEGVLVESKPTGADDSSMAGMAEADGVQVYVKIEKSRTCRPMRSGAMQFDYKTLQYDDIAELASSGLYFGIIYQKASWFSLVDDQGELHKIGQGLKTVYARLREDEELRQRIYARLMDYTHEI